MKELIKRNNYVFCKSQIKKCEDVLRECCCLLYL